MVHHSHSSWQYPRFCVPLSFTALLREITTLDKPGAHFLHACGRQSSHTREKRETEESEQLYIYDHQHQQRPSWGSEISRFSNHLILTLSTTSLSKHLHSDITNPPSPQMISAWSVEVHSTSMCLCFLPSCCSS